MKKVIIYLVLFVLFAILFFNALENKGDYTIKEIRKEYKGVVIEIFSSREGIPPTFLKIKDFNNEIHDLSVSDEVIRFSAIGDTILKLSNDNFITIYSKNKKRSFHFMKISDKLRGQRNFPEEWKDMWLESKN